MKQGKDLIGWRVLIQTGQCSFTGKRWKRKEKHREKEGAFKGKGDNGELTTRGEEGKRIGHTDGGNTLTSLQTKMGGRHCKKEKRWGGREGGNEQSRNESMAKCEKRGGGRLFRQVMEAFIRCRKHIIQQ